MRTAFILGLIILLVPVFLAVTAVAHPNQCQPCHGPKGTTTDSAGTFWNHTIKDGPVVWNYCTQCHSNYVQGTKHEQIGCKCHAVMHVGYGNTNKVPGFFGAVFYWEPTGVQKVIAPTTLTLAGYNVTFDDTNYTAYGIPAAWIPAGGMNIEVGLWDPFNNITIQVGTQNVYKSCFGCHFLATDPSTVGAYAIVDGKIKIGIPEFALKLPPHEIYDVEMSEMSSTLSTISFQVVAAGLGALLGMVVLFVSIRKS